MTVPLFKHSQLRSSSKRIIRICMGNHMRFINSCNSSGICSLRVRLDRALDRDRERVLGGAENALASVTVYVRPGSGEYVKSRVEDCWMRRKVHPLSCQCIVEFEVASVYLVLVILMYINPLNLLCYILFKSTVQSLQIKNATIVLGSPHP